MGGTGQARRTLVAAIEDMSTAGVVAVAAARVAREMGADHIALMHALDEHAMLNAVYGAANYAAPVAETAEEGERVLELAEAALRAEYAGLDAPAPTVERMVVDGPPARAIEQAAAAPGVVGVVLGARRPHAFGRLTHPDVRARVSARIAVPVHVAALQAGHEERPVENKEG